MSKRKKVSQLSQMSVLGVSAGIGNALVNKFLPQKEKEEIIELKANIPMVHFAAIMEDKELTIIKQNERMNRLERMWDEEREQHGTIKKKVGAYHQRFELSMDSLLSSKETMKNKLEKVKSLVKNYNQTISDLNLTDNLPF